MIGGEIPGLMFVGLFVLIFIGIPVSFSFLLVAAVGGLLVFPPAVAATQVHNLLVTIASNWLLSAVPPFIFMGYVLEHSGIGRILFNAIRDLLGPVPGGIALTTMVMAGMFAATTGIVGAVEILIGVLAIPAMMRLKYAKSLISGTICAGGSLGTMIPPTIVVVIYSSVASISVARLFAAVLLPALLMVGLFLVYILGRCILRPADGGARWVAQDGGTVAVRLLAAARAVVPVVFLIALVLGSILTGLASPTEAASLGAAGAVALAAVNRSLTLGVVRAALRETVWLSSMILLIVVGGKVFSAVFHLQGGNAQIADLVAAIDPGPAGAVALMLTLVFFAGFVFDWVSVVLIALPIFLPILTAYDVDSIWFATLMIIVIQTSYLTPPMAPSIFYLRSISPPEISFADMYRGVIPFIICQLIVLLTVVFFPSLATWLPSRINVY
ncbi:MAG: TRAP transporter large permease subunit [Hyphomicrobiales bacterium]|nr:TRAP transporter large permease subunit [Hyphomicrobiales bacterium]